MTILEYASAGAQNPVSARGEQGLPASLAGWRQAMEQARTTWYGGYGSDGEGSEPEYLLLFSGMDPLDREFTDLAGLLRTVLALTEITHAAA